MKRELKAVTPQRSKIMSAIRSNDTRPELMVRSALHKLGYRYKLHDPSLPGKPDIVLPRYRTIILVNGCFWHSHQCEMCRIPRSNKSYWLPKLQRNSERDASNERKLRRLGWSVKVLWECKLRKMSVAKLEGNLESLLSARLKKNSF